MSQEEHTTQTPKSSSTGFPFISIILILIACIHYDYRTPRWEFYMPGLPGGILVLSIIGVALLFRIFNLLQDVCIARGLITARVQSRYEVLLPVGILAVLIKWHAFGDLVEGMEGEQVYQWEFHWSDPKLDAPFIAALIAVVLLLRVRALLYAIQGHANVNRMSN